MSVGSMMFTRFGRPSSYTSGLWKLKPDNGIYYRLFNTFIQSSLDGITPNNQTLDSGFIEAYLYYPDPSTYLLGVYAGNYPYYIPIGFNGTYYAATQSDYQNTKQSATNIRL